MGGGIQNHSAKNSDLTVNWDLAVRERARTERRYLTEKLKDREFPQGPPVYWEGACTVKGTETGYAFVELVGYKP